MIDNNTVHIVLVYSQFAYNYKYVYTSAPFPIIKALVYDVAVSQMRVTVSPRAVEPLKPPPPFKSSVAMIRSEVLIGRGIASVAIGMVGLEVSQDLIQLDGIQ